jgi:hypothetical protein
LSVNSTALVAEDDGSLDGTGPREAVLRDTFVNSLVERLHVEYGVDRNQIRAHATEVLATFATARVQAFVPILVEKELRQTYRVLSRAVALC